MKGIIYMIKCKDENIKDCYIGSTFNLDVRKSHHKSNCNNVNKKSYNFKVYKFIRENGNWENFKVDKLLEVEVNDKKEIKEFENEQCNLLQPSLNCNKPLITIDLLTYHREYYNTKYKDYHKKRYEDKKDEYQERNRKFYAKVKTLLEQEKNKI